MNRVYTKQLERVKRYLDRSNRRSLLREFQATVKSELDKAFERPKLVGLVNEVFSRAAKDPDNPLKSDKKIAIKLYKWERANRTDEVSPADVHDIAGVTIVCNYPSDTDEIAEYLKSEFSCNIFRIEKVSFRDPANTKGYRAYHAIARGSGKFHGLCCELQIKTLLTMSWGAKTHDLTYKPPGEIDERLNLYMEKLSYVALILDEQSEILKSLIYDAWELDSARRRVASMQIVLGVKRSNDKDAQDLLRILQRNADNLSVANLSDELPSQILQKFDFYIKSNGYSKEICRIGAIFALMRTFGDRNDWAIELIDDWIFSLDNCSNEENSAISFRSLVSMALARISHEDRCIVGPNQ